MMALITDVTYAPEYKDQAQNKVSIESTSYPKNEIVNLDSILTPGGKRRRSRKQKSRRRRARSTMGRRGHKRR